MQVIFWGVRGSIPSPVSNVDVVRKLKRLLVASVKAGVKSASAVERFWRQAPLSDKITFGGNTSCVEVRQGNAYLILDAGSGLCPLGRHIVHSRRDLYPNPCHVFLTHYHWDHILGFPFFRPAYRPGNEIVIHSASPDAGRFFRVQQSLPFFPAGLEFMPAKISFQTLRPGEGVTVGPFKVSTILLPHPGDSMGFKIESGGESLVYMTDLELLKASTEDCVRFQEFVKGVDVAIVDTQYGMLESHEKADWGHSTAFHWIDLLHDKGVKNLFLFHYEPLRTDEEIADILERAQDYLHRLHPRARLHVHGSHEGQRFSIRRRK